MYSIEEHIVTPGEPCIVTARDSNISDAELDQLKAEYQNKLTALDAAIAQYENLLHSLQDVAKESTLGTSSDLSAATTIFGRLKSIIDFLTESETTNQYAKAGSGTNVTNTDLKNLLNGISTAMYKGVPVVTPQGSGTQANPYVLQPNQWNQFSNALSGGDDIYFSKGTDIANITNCYMVRFELAANWSGTSVNFEGFSLDWNGGSVPTWTAGKTYEVNIVDNIAMWADITPAS